MWMQLQCCLSRWQSGKTWLSPCHLACNRFVTQTWWSEKRNHRVIFRKEPLYADSLQHVQEYADTGNTYDQWNAIVKAAPHWDENCQFWQFCQFNLYEAIPANTDICITFVQCRPIVFDVGPTLYKCYTNVLCLLGYSLGLLILNKIQKYKKTMLKHRKKRN